MSVTLHIPNEDYKTEYDRQMEQLFQKQAQQQEFLKNAQGNVGLIQAQSGLASGMAGQPFSSVCPYDLDTPEFYIWSKWQEAINDIKRNETHIALYTAAIKGHADRRDRYAAALEKLTGDKPGGESAAKAPEPKPILKW